MGTPKLNCLLRGPVPSTELPLSRRRCHRSIVPPTQTQGVELEPQDARAYEEQASSYIHQGKHKKARACIKEVLRLEPDYASAHNNLGNILYYQRRYNSALRCYEKALSLEPDFEEAYSNWGKALVALGRHEEAMINCQQAIKLEPNNARAYNILGNAFKGLGKMGEASASYQEALRINPDYAEARNNMGAVLADSNHLDEAVAHYLKALRLKPDLPEAYHNLGIVLLKQSNWEHAVVLLQHALRLQPKNAEACYDLGYALDQQGKHEEAANSFQRAIRLKPVFPAAHWALAFNLLLRGDFEHGWRELEWRWRLKKYPLRSFHQPVWDGSPLGGRTILLHAEWGLGDTIQFVRYAALVKHHGGTVMVECQKSLLPLLANCPGIDQLVAAGSELPAFDVQAPLLSLPRILKTSLATVPADIPYLSADPELQGKWQRKLSRYRGFKIGIAWQGNPQIPSGRKRSIPLIHFAPLARLKGVCLISLQKGPGTEQLGTVAAQFRVIRLGSRVDEKSGAFMDTAAVMKNLDLVITCDTSVAHLAGALGVPVWVALPHLADWRWLLDREDSPWYPAMRLFRQTKPGDWEGVFARMAEELAKRVAASTRQRPITIEIAPGELIDKITILEIKTEKIRDSAKLRNIHAELHALQTVRDREIKESELLAKLTSKLKAINQRLWIAEDEIRRCEEAKDFGPRFINLARSVYRQNDRRSLLKQQINNLLGSSIVEEKLYPSYR